MNGQQGGGGDGGSPRGPHMPEGQDPNEFDMTGPVDATVVNIGGRRPASPFGRRRGQRRGHDRLRLSPNELPPSDGAA